MFFAACDAGFQFVNNMCEECLIGEYSGVREGGGAWRSHVCTTWRFLQENFFSLPVNT